MIVMIYNRAKGSTMLNLSAHAIRTVTVTIPPRCLKELYDDCATVNMQQIKSLDTQNQKLPAARD
jgi:hypothetical protein